MGLTLEEAIKHAREVAREKHYEATFNFPELKGYYDSCLECAEEHDQLAKWLEELKSLREFVNNQNEWILVSDRLPEEHQSVFAGFKGTRHWINRLMFEKESDNVLVTIRNHKKLRTSVAKTIDGRWKTSPQICDDEVIAWMPIPYPYHESNNEVGK